MIKEVIDIIFKITGAEAAQSKIQEVLRTISRGTAIPQVTQAVGTNFKITQNYLTSLEDLLKKFGLAGTETGEYLRNVLNRSLLNFAGIAHFSAGNIQRFSKSLTTARNDFIRLGQLGTVHAQRFSQSLLQLKPVDLIFASQARTVGDLYEKLKSLGAIPPGIGIKRFEKFYTELQPAFLGIQRTADGFIHSLVKLGTSGATVETTFHKVRSQAVSAMTAPRVSANQLTEQLDRIAKISALLEERKRLLPGTERDLPIIERINSTLRHLQLSQANLQKAQQALRVAPRDWTAQSKAAQTYQHSLYQVDRALSVLGMTINQQLRRPFITFGDVLAQVAGTFGAFSTQVAKAFFRTTAFLVTTSLEIASFYLLNRALQEAAWFQLNAQIAAVALDTSYRNLAGTMSELTLIAATTGRDISNASRLFYEAAQVFKLGNEGLQQKALLLEIVRNSFMSAIISGISFYEAEANLLPILKLLNVTAQDVSKVFSYLTYVQDQTGVNADYLAKQVSYLGGSFTSLDYLISQSADTAKQTQEDFYLVASTIALMQREMTDPGLMERVSRFLTTLQNPETAIELQKMGLSTKSLADFIRSLMKFDLTGANLNELAQSVILASGLSRREGIFIFRLLQVVNEARDLMGRALERPNYLAEKFRASLGTLTIQFRVLSSSVLALIVNLSRLGVTTGLAALLTVVNSILVSLIKLTGVMATLVEQSIILGTAFKLMGAGLGAVGGALAFSALVLKPIGAIRMFFNRLNTITAEAVGTLDPTAHSSRILLFSKNLSTSVRSFVQSLITLPSLGAIKVAGITFAAGVVLSLAEGIIVGLQSGEGINWEAIGRDAAVSMLAAIVSGIGFYLTVKTADLLKVAAPIIAAKVGAAFSKGFLAILTAIFTAVAGAQVYQLAVGRRPELPSPVANVVFPIQKSISDFVLGFVEQVSAGVFSIAIAASKLLEPKERQILSPEDVMRRVEELKQTGNLIDRILAAVYEFFGLFYFREVPAQRKEPLRQVKPFEKPLTIEQITARYEAGLITFNEAIALFPQAYQSIKNLEQAFNKAADEEQKIAYAQKLQNERMKLRQAAQQLLQAEIEKAITIAKQARATQARTAIIQSLLQSLELLGTKGIPQTERISAVDKAAQAFLNAAQENARIAIGYTEIGLKIPNFILQQIATNLYSALAIAQKVGVDTQLGQQILMESVKIAQSLAEQGVNIVPIISSVITGVGLIHQAGGSVLQRFAQIRDSLAGFTTSALMAEKQYMRALQQPTTKTTPLPDISGLLKTLQAGVSKGLSKFRGAVGGASRGAARVQKELWELLQAQWNYYKTITEWSIRALTRIEPLPTRFINRYIGVLRGARKAALGRRDYEKAAQIEQAIQDVIRTRAEVAKEIIERRFVVPIAVAERAGDEIKVAKLQVDKAKAVLQATRRFYQTKSKEVLEAQANYYQALRNYAETLYRVGREQIERDFKKASLDFISDTTRASLEFSKAVQIYNLAVRRFGDKSKEALEAQLEVEEAHFNLLKTQLSERESILEKMVDLELISSDMLAAFYTQQISIYSRDLNTQLEYRRKLRDLMERVGESFREAIGLPEIRIPTPHEVQRALINQLVQNVAFNVSIASNVDTKKFLEQVSRTLFGTPTIGGALATYV